MLVFLSLHVISGWGIRHSFCADSHIISAARVCTSIHSSDTLTAWLATSKLPFSATNRVIIRAPHHPTRNNEIPVPVRSMVCLEKPEYIRRCMDPHSRGMAERRCISSSTVSSQLPNVTPPACFRSQVQICTYPSTTIQHPPRCTINKHPRMSGSFPEHSTSKRFSSRPSHPEPASQRDQTRHHARLHNSEAGAYLPLLAN